MSYYGKPSRNDWRTPQWLFDKINAEFNLKIDVAAADNNHLLPLYFTKENSAFDNEWTQNAWANIPYDNPTNMRFAQRALAQCFKYNIIVAMLFKIDTSVKWQQEHVLKAAYEVRMFTHRIQFEAPHDSEYVKPTGATFPNALAVYKPIVRATGVCELSFYDYKTEVPTQICRWV